MDYKELFTKPEGSFWRHHRWLASVLLRKTDEIIPDEDIALNVGLGVMLVRDGQYDEAMKIEAQPVLTFSDFLKNENFERILGFAPQYNILRYQIYKYVVPRLIKGKGYKVISPPYSYGYCLTTVPDPNWRIKLGAFSHITVVDHLLAHSSEMHPLPVDHIAEFLNNSMIRKYTRMAAVFPDFTRDILDVTYDQGSINFMIRYLRKKLKKIRAPFIIPKSEKGLGYWIKPLTPMINEP
ncbi:MAG TPA: hypothetical protein VJC17_03375 [Candidatus Dojkabacteria bacterium]|nr:hypothetical protein [Candidatus Dojkabacteria bacterium]